ncbi:MAG: hypothetical protein Q8M09_19760 [Pseudomonadota bacterium]|nr:hypothetical protein [Pseudomonadota bacterium]MDP1906454.1 hypothetical protein [Pseudomonadota bacterium]MDP2353133.1 hypothetical protein [Pseudomonadota bacterium]
MPKKYAFPAFLAGVVSQDVYLRWLQRKAQAHVKRDRRRGNVSATNAAYKQAIHAAVLDCAGRDSYTGDWLQWERISQYDNDESKEQGRHYKKGLALLPTVDHVGDGTGAADFVICGWRTNDTKNDLSLSEFISVCQAVLKHQGFVIQRSGNSNNNGPEEA